MTDKQNSGKNDASAKRVNMCMLQHEQALIMHVTKSVSTMSSDPLIGNKGRRTFLAAR